MTGRYGVGGDAAAEEHPEVRPDLARPCARAPAALARLGEQLLEEEREPARRPGDGADVVVEVALGDDAELLVVVGDALDVVVGQVHRPRDDAASCVIISAGFDVMRTGPSCASS